MQRPDEAPAAGDDLRLAYLDQQFQRLHHRLDTLDRHAADQMFLQIASQNLVLGTRREFSGLSKEAILRAVAAEPFDGQCPCCGDTRVLTEAGRPVRGADAARRSG